MRKMIDVSADKNLTDTSPIAAGVFAFMLVITSALVPATTVVFYIIVLIEYLLSMIFFQHSPRIVYLTLLFLFKHEKLSPTFEDKDFVFNENEIVELSKIKK